MKWVTVLLPLALLGCATTDPFGEVPCQIVSSEIVRSYDGDAYRRLTVSFDNPTTGAHETSTTLVPLDGWEAALALSGSACLVPSFGYNHLKLARCKNQ